MTAQPYAKVTSKVTGFGLTEGKEYYVYGESESYWVVRCNDGKIYYRDKAFFEEEVIDYGNDN